MLRARVVPSTKSIKAQHYLNTELYKITKKKTVLNIRSNESLLLEQICGEEFLVPCNFIKSTLYLVIK